MTRRSVVCCVAILAASLVPTTVSAQNPGLSGLLLRFFAPSNPVILANTGHAAHFGSQPSAEATLTEFNKGIAAQLSTFPLGSSSGGFSYTFDPALGVFNRSTESFGPLFAERALTLGKGKVAFGANYTRSTFDTFEGQNLRAGDITLFLVHVELGQPGDVLNNPSFFFEGDMIKANLFVNLKADTVAFFMSYGVTDKLDVGFALPYERLQLNVRIHEHIARFSTDVSPFLFHTFNYGDPNSILDDNDVRQSGTAEGFGDLVLRGKYNFKRSEAGGLAVGMDVRLPTADETQLLGSGATQAKVFLIASGGSQRFSPHFNVGYTFSKGGSLATGNLPQEMNYTLGFDAALGHRVTITGDVIGRTLLNTQRISKIETDHKYRHGFSGPILTTTITDFGTQKGDLNILLGSAGIKLNPFGRFLISANVLTSQGKRGLQDFFTPIVAMDYSF